MWDEKLPTSDRRICCDGILGALNCNTVLLRNEKLQVKSCFKDPVERCS